MTEFISLGMLNTDLFRSEFGILKTDEIIVTSERISHIKKRHPDDYSLFKELGKTVVENPDIIIKDQKNKNTVFMVKKLANTNLNAVVKLVLDKDETNYKNSVMTFYRIRQSNLNKLQSKNKTLYKKE